MSVLFSSGLGSPPRVYQRPHTSSSSCRPPSANLQWRMDKLGHMVDPLNVVQNGSQRLHGNVELDSNNKSLMILMPQAWKVHLGHLVIR